MSDYDSNPFADPETVANPFEDSAVHQAAGGQRDEFNPFTEGGKAGGAKTTPVVLPPPQKPATSTPAIITTQDPPPYSQPSVPPPVPMAQDDLIKRQEELERKAAELQRKEQAMRTGQFNARANNWPPLPDFLPVGPCFYQDFNVDIPLEFQKTVKACYYLWLMYFIVLVLNMIGSIAYFSVTSGSAPGICFALSLVYLIIFTPCSFVCWYRPVYKAFRSDSSFNFFFFFFVMFCQIITNFIFCAGINSVSCGWINGAKVVGDGRADGKPGNIAVGCIMIVLGLFFTILGILSIVALAKVHRLYRTTGASFAKAQQEFSTNIVTNPGVQSTAKSAAQGAAQGAFTSATTTPSGNQM